MKAGLFGGVLNSGRMNTFLVKVSQPLKNNYASPRRIHAHGISLGARLINHGLNFCLVNDGI